ncbi:MAG: 4Fe-4S protein, partial [Methanobacterium sp. Maddingley MBC34]
MPLVARIDKDYCIDCKLCDQACGNGAIDHDQKTERIEIDVGTIIVATGYDPYNPTEKKEYSYADAQN